MPETKGRSTTSRFMCERFSPSEREQETGVCTGYGIHASGGTYIHMLTTPLVECRRNLRTHIPKCKGILSICIKSPNLRSLMPLKSLTPITPKKDHVQRHQHSLSIPSCAVVFSHQLADTLWSQVSRSPLNSPMITPRATPRAARPPGLCVCPKKERGME